MDEQLYRKCPECGGQGEVTDHHADKWMQTFPCGSCDETGFVPVDAPEPLTGEEIGAMIRAHTDMMLVGDYAETHAERLHKFSVAMIAAIEALPERFGVRMEGTTDETR